MSAFEVRWVRELRDPRLRLGPKAALLVMASYLPMGGRRIFTSRETLQADMACARKTVDAAIKELVALGYIRPLSTRSGNTKRRIEWEYLGGRYMGEGTEDDASNMVVSAMSNGVGFSGNTPLSAPIVYIEGGRRKKEATASLPGLSALPDWIPLEAWEAFMEIRRAKKAPHTEYAMSLLIRRLDRFRKAGHSPEDVLDYSIQGGYVGVFEPKEKPKAAPAPAGGYARGAI